MKTKLIFVLFLLTRYALIAQKEYKVSAFYDYSIKFDVGNSFYPLGFGSNISKSLSGNLLLSAGLEYSHLYKEDHEKISPPVFRTREIQKESILSVTSGLSYPLLQKKFVLSIGAEIVASGSWYRFDSYRYTVADGALDLYQRYKDVTFGLGLRLKSEVEYHLTKGICLFVRPGYTYYVLGEARKNKFFNTSAGLSFSL